MAINLFIAALRFDALTAFGLVAVSLMLAFYAVEDRSAWFVLAFAAACVLGSIYGFLQGAWPFGIVEGVWSVVAFRRWWIDPRRVVGLGDEPASDWPGPPNDGPGTAPRRPRGPQPAERWMTERI